MSKTTTPNVSVENNHRFSHKNNHSLFSKHHIASNKIPTNKKISSAPNIVKFMEENRNDSIIYRSIQMDKAINKPGLKNKPIFSEFCDAQYLCETNTVTSIESYTMCRNGTEICTRIPYILKHLGSYTCGYCNQPQQSQQVARLLGDSFFPGITVKTTKRFLYRGEDIEIISSITDYESMSCWEYLRIFSANTEDYVDSFIFAETWIDSCNYENFTTSMVINWKPGNYRAVVVSIYGLPLAVSSSFRVMKQTAKLISSSETYSLGETIYLIAFDFIVPLRADEFIRIIRANVSRGFHNATYASYSSIGEFSGARNSAVPFYANWKVGRYKAVLFLKESTVVLAVSNVFEIKNPIVEVSTSKRTYYQGEDIVVTLDFIHGNPLRNHDQIGIVLSNVTKFFESAQFITRTYGDQVFDEKVNFYTNELYVGKYRAVFLSEDSYAKSMSQVFKVKENRIQLNTTKTTYYQRDDIIFSFKSVSGVPFRSGDWLKIIAADITSDYLGAPFADLFSIGSTVRGLTFGNISKIINWSVGKYKAVFFINGFGFASAVSNEFNVLQKENKENKIQLNSTKTIYYYRGDIQLIIQSLGGVRFCCDDSVRIIPANINSDYYDASFVYWDYTDDVYGLTSGNITITVYWDVGEYKAVFFMGGSTVASAVSDEFHILPNIIQLNSTKTTYKRFEPIVLMFSSISGVPFRYNDEIRIVPTNEDDGCESGHGFLVFTDFMRVASGLTSGNISIPRIYAVGKFKAVIYYEFPKTCAAISNEFDIL